MKKQYEEKEAENFGDSILGDDPYGGTEEETRDLVSARTIDGAPRHQAVRGRDRERPGRGRRQKPALGVKSLDALAPRGAARVRVKLEENGEFRGATLEAMRLYKTAVMRTPRECTQIRSNGGRRAEETQTLMGGKIQIQKALGLDANGKRMTRWRCRGATEAP